jgi:anti-sigma regulatory factor (Ser/Thr protein kinase)
MEARRAQAPLRTLDNSPAERVVGSWEAIPEAVSMARRAVVEFACRHNATPAALAAIELAVSEAMTNAVQHAYPDADAPGPVTITGATSDALLIIHVTDKGAGMRPRPDSPGLGLGLPLISQMTQSFEVHEPAGGGTALCMRFDLARGQL